MHPPSCASSRRCPLSGKGQPEKALKRRNASGFTGVNFIPWVPDVADDTQDLEEEEQMERTAGLLDR